MGRPPCCDKIGIKKGPWTPEEDIILVSYIQEHGPGNWRAVPTNTGLLRCSKSCRLRWTNYLRPGIKRDNFTPHEEGMIIHLQALLGNKWAAIATYLPQRTDNDIKNYWNTHLKKKLKKYQLSNSDRPEIMASNCHKFISKGVLENNGNKHHQLGFMRMNDHNSSSSSSSLYASSEVNISRLLQGWMKPLTHQKANLNPNLTIMDKTYGYLGEVQCYKPQKIEQEEVTNGMNPTDQDLDSVLSCDRHRLRGNCSCDSSHKGSESSGLIQEEEVKPIVDNNNPPLTFLEKWLLDESVSGQVEEVMELPQIF